jgi:hypothetical protein
MPTIRTSDLLPVHANLSETPRATNWCQRWNLRQHSWTHRRAGGFRAELYRVVPIAERTARSYVCSHHYSGSFPAARRSYGLYVTGTAPTDPALEPDPAAPRDSDLVGVAVFGIPVRRAVLTNPLPDLEPYIESLELSRFVLEGDVLTLDRPAGRAPGNSESWFLARALGQLADEDVRAVVAFSDLMLASESVSGTNEEVLLCGCQRYQHPGREGVLGKRKTATGPRRSFVCTAPGMISSKAWLVSPLSPARSSTVLGSSPDSRSCSVWMGPTTWN